MGSNPTLSDLEKCLSGRKEQFAKLSYGEICTPGSNPGFSDPIQETMTENSTAIRKLKQFLLHIQSEKGLSQIALLPLFFSWYPIIVLKYENITIRKNCLYSLILTSIFFICILIGGIVSKFPYFGSISANIIHFIGVIYYLGASGFFIYSLQKEKNMVLPFGEKFVKTLETYLIEKERP